MGSIAVVAVPPAAPADPPVALQAATVPQDAALDASIPVAALAGYASHRLWSMDAIDGDGPYGEPQPAHVQPCGGLHFNILTVATAMSVARS